MPSLGDRILCPTASRDECPIATESDRHYRRMDPATDGDPRAALRRRGVATSDLALVPRRKRSVALLEKRDIDMIVSHVYRSSLSGAGVYLQRSRLTQRRRCEVRARAGFRNQCSGFVYGLATAASMVKSGGARHVLLVGAEIHSHAIDLTTRGRQVSTLFGDGAGAVVVSATDENRGVRGWYLGADGRFADSLCQKVWDISKFPYIDVNEQGRGRSRRSCSGPRWTESWCFVTPCSACAKC